jgi:hypothetical protein
VAEGILWTFRGQYSWRCLGICLVVSVKLPGMGRRNSGYCREISLVADWG